MKKGDKVMYYSPEKFDGKEWLYISFEVTVMGVIDGYVMLRRGPQFFPFVESVRAFKQWQEHPPKLVQP
jgi:hypothetical protein